MKIVIIVISILLSQSLWANEVIIGNKKYILTGDGIQETDLHNGKVIKLEKTKTFKKLIKFNDKLVALDQYGNVQIRNENWEKIGEQASAIGEADGKLFKLHKNGSLEFLENKSPRQIISGYIHNDGSIQLVPMAMKSEVNFDGSSTLVSTFATAELYQDQFVKTPYRNGYDITYHNGKAYLLFKSGAISPIGSLDSKVITYFEIESKYLGFSRTCVEKDSYTRGKEFYKEHPMEKCEDILAQDIGVHKAINDSKRTPIKEIESKSFESKPQSISK